MKARLKSNSTPIVYFSRTGTTRKAAHVIARMTGADLLEIKAKRYTQGLLGYVRAGWDATFGRTVPIQARQVDLSRYEQVIVGTPIWNAAVSAPVRAYLAMNGEQMSRVAFFITHGGSGASRALRQMREISKKAPVANLSLRTVDVRRGLQQRNVEAKLRHFFIETLQTAVQRRAA